MRGGDRILAAILRGQPRQIARPGTSPQVFFGEKRTFAIVLSLFWRRLRVRGKKVGEIAQRRNQLRSTNFPVCWSWLACMDTASLSAIGLMRVYVTPLSSPPSLALVSHVLLTPNWGLVVKTIEWRKPAFKRHCLPLGTRLTKSPQISLKNDARATYGKWPTIVTNNGLKSRLSAFSL